MSTDDNFPDEKLHLFIDGEMDSHDRAEVMEALRQDESLSYRVCELLQLKDAVRLAYDNPPASGNQTSRWKASSNSRSLINAVAAVLILAVGVAGGWLIYPAVTDYDQQLNVASLSGTSPAFAEQQQTDKIILHISKSNPKQFAAALDYTERFLAEHNDSHQIDVVAHAGGLDVMRDDVSPVRDKILALIDKYSNVHFIACAGAIKVYTKANGEAPDIIRGVGTDSTAFDHIVNRLQGGGWKYIKVESIIEI